MSSAVGSRGNGTHTIANSTITGNTVTETSGARRELTLQGWGQICFATSNSAPSRPGGAVEAPTHTRSMYQTSERK